MKKQKINAWRGLCALAFAMLAGLSFGAHAQTPIENVAPGDALARLKAHKGVIVLNITSTDPKCTYCIRANTKYVALAQSVGAEAKFIQTSWAPWANFPPEIRELMKLHDIGGVPARLTYKDGVLVNKLVGEPPNEAAPAAPSVQKVTGHVPQVLPAKIAAHIAATPGVLVVELTSFETSCVFCMKGNPTFEAWTQSTGVGSAKFARVVYTPWVSVGQDGFAKGLGVAGLPAYFTYRDGQLLRTKTGAASTAELQKDLLDGL
jgi:thiol-disulfide isomerase/thioredoxin